MSIFDKFKKKKVEEVPVEAVDTDVQDLTDAVAEVQDEVAENKNSSNAELQEEAELSSKMREDAQEQFEETDDSDEEEHRFTLMVEDAFQLEDNNGVVVVGNLHGKMKKGDKIYVLFPNNRMIISTAEEMEIGPGRRVTEAEDEKVALQIFEVKKKEYMPPFTVITNIAPNLNTQNAREIENPMLLGMSMEYPTRGPEPTYNNILIYMICHSKYVVPASLNAANAAPGKVPQIQFPSLVDPSDTSRHVLPVFTDWNALSRWEGVFDEKHPEQAAILTFQEAVSVCQGKGIVINPFGPMVISVSAENIQQIINLESYKKEFGTGEKPASSSANEGTKNNNSAATKQSDAPRMMLGVPKEDKPEVKAVTDAIVAYAKGETSIKRIDLLLKVDLQQKKSFVCVIDCPQNQTARIGAEIQKAASPKLKEVEKIEFFLYGSAKFVNDMVSEKSIIYQR